MVPHSKSLTYRPEIDGLRALAVTVVILFHAGLGCPGGYVGVDIFFVISGFLITSLIVKEMDAGTFTLRNFYERRVRRILPASMAVTMAVLAVGYFLMLPLDLEYLGRSAVAHAVFSANFFFYSQAANYFDAPVESAPLLHMWSLAVEEQFYFVYPLLLCVCYRRLGRARLMVLLSVLLLCGGGYSVFSVSHDPIGAFYLLPSRSGELLIGAVLAMLPDRGASRALREIGSTVGLAAMLVPVFLYDLKTPFPGLAALSPCAGAALFIWASRARVALGDEPTTHQPLLGRLLATRGPVWVGTISYSLYLCHWPILSLGRYWQVGPATLVSKLGVVAASFAAAMVLWRFVEVPFRSRRLLNTSRLTFGAAAVGIVFLVIIGIFFKATLGVPSRFNATVNALDNVRRQRLHFPQMQTAEIRRDNLTVFGVKDRNTPVSVLVWGDSHAGAALPAFDAFSKAHGLSGRAAMHSSTTPLFGYYTDSPNGLRRESLDYNAAVVEYIRRAGIKTVVLVNYWERDTQNDPAALERGLRQTIDALPPDVTLYVMLQMPSYPVDVPKALAHDAIKKHISLAWRQTLQDHVHHRAVMYTLARKFESNRCKFIDPAPAFELVPGEPLEVINHGRSLYRDSHHLSPWGVQKILEPFLEKALRPADVQAAASTTKPSE